MLPILNFDNPAKSNYVNNDFICLVPVNNVSQFCTHSSGTMRTLRGGTRRKFPALNPPHFQFRSRSGIGRLFPASGCFWKGSGHAFPAGFPLRERNIPVSPPLPPREVGFASAKYRIQVPQPARNSRGNSQGSVVYHSSSAPKTALNHVIKHAHWLSRNSAFRSSEFISDNEIRATHVTSHNTGSSNYHFYLKWSRTLRIQACPDAL